MQDDVEYLKSLLEHKYPDKVVTSITNDRALYYTVKKQARSRNLSLKELFTSLGFTYVRRPRISESVASSKQDQKSAELLKCSDSDFCKVMQEIINENHIKSLGELDAFSHRYYKVLKRRADRTHMVPKKYCEQIHLKFESIDTYRPSKKSNVSCRELLYLSEDYAIEVKDIAKLCNISRQYINLVAKESLGKVSLAEYTLDQEALDNVESTVKAKRNLVETEDFYLHICKHRTENRYIVLYKNKNSNISYYITNLPNKLLRLIENNFPTKVSMTKINKVMEYIQQNKEKLGYKVSSSGVGYITKVNMTCYREVAKLLGISNKVPFITVCKNLNIILDLKPITYRSLNSNQQQLLVNTLKQGYVFAECNKSVEYRTLLGLANKKGVSLTEYLKPYGILYLPYSRYYKIFEK